MATIVGTSGSDTITGTAGSDHLTGGAGNDRIEGGDGDDVIVDEVGANVIVAGAGNDRITVTINGITNSGFAVPTANRVDAGDGDDLLTFMGLWYGSLNAQMGAGNDVVDIHTVLSYTDTVALTLGAGSDRVVLGFALGNGHRAGSTPTITITDFTAGDGGDSLDIGGLLDGLVHNPSAFTSFPALNPFASGHMLLVQDGADVILRYDINGPAGNLNEFYTRDIARLINVNASQLTAFNFAGLAPNGAAPVSRSLTGSAAGDILAGDGVATTIDGLGGNDTLLGGRGADTLRGGDGNDRIEGRFGDDRIEGGTGNDNLEGGEGDDVLIGGDGDDVISDSRYGAQIDGGAGNDLISLTRRQSRLDLDDRGSTVSVVAGDGNDRVDILLLREFSGFPDPNPRQMLATVDLGTGDDVFRLTLFNALVDLTLGAGRDLIEIGRRDVGNPALTVRDFTAGDGGDRISFYDFLFNSGTEWDRVTNPFESGHIRLVQQGADVLLAFDYDGAGGKGEYEGLALLRNVQVSQLTAANFEGYAPGGGAPVVLNAVGTAAADVLRGGAGGDSLSGGDGDDAIEAGAGNDSVNGDAGNDRLSGGYGIDVLRGGAGDDVLENRGSNGDMLIGGDGNDVITSQIGSELFGFSPSRTTIVDGGAGDDVVEVFDLTAVVTLGSGNDRLLFGRAATISLGEGSDIVTISLGYNTVAQGVITDFQTGDGGDRLDFAGDLIRLTYGNPWSIDPEATLGLINPFASGHARLIQNGNDVEIVYTESPLVDGIENGTPYRIVTLRDVQASALTAFNLGFDPSHVTLAGSPADETLNGTSGRDVIRGLNGSDAIFGDDGDDVLRGEQGNDVLNGGAGFDYLTGGAGFDQLLGGDGNDFLSDSGDADILDGGGGNDFIGGDSGNVIRGGSGDDAISLVVSTFGLQGSIEAGDGNDRVTARIQDQVSFGASPYRIDLGAGDDLFITEGYTGLVTLGAGRDRVEFTGGPYRGAIITDFQAGDNGDVIDIDSVVREYNLPVDATRALQFGYLQLVQSGADTLIYIRRTLDTGFVQNDRIVLQNVQMSALTAYNFDGFSPALATSLPAPRLFSTNTTLSSNSVINVVDARPVNDGFNTPIVVGTGGVVVTLTNNGIINARVTQGGLFPLIGVSGSGATETPSLFRNGTSGVVDVALAFPPEIAGVPGGGLTYGFFARRAISLLNEGRFSVSSNYGDVIGIFAEPNIGTPVVIDNRGQFSVTSVRDATGAIIRTDARFVNTGAITVHGDRIATGVDGTLNNAGTITVTTSVTSRFASVGMFLEIGNPPNLNVTATNSGTITADIAVWLFDDFPGTNTRSNDTYFNSGTIDGAIVMGRGNDRLVNSGTIFARSLLQDGNDSYDGSAGRHNGSVEGGNGDDLLIGGRFADTLFGDNGDDIVSAGSGDDYVEGGNGNDMLDGGVGIDIVSYAASVGTITVDLREGMAQSSTERDFVRNFEIFVGSRGGDSLLGDDVRETLFGYVGDDVIEGRGGDDILIGGLGSDRLTGGEGLDRFLFDAGDGADIITDFTGGDVIEIFGYTAAQSLTQVGGDVRITLSASDSILVRGTTVAALTPTNLRFTTTASGIDLPDIPTDTYVGQGTVLFGAGAELVLLNPSTPRGFFSTAFSGGVLVDTSLTNGGGGLWNNGSISLTVTEGEGIAYGVRHATTVYSFGGQFYGYIGGATSRLTVSSSVGNAVGTTVETFWNAGIITVSSSNGDAVGVTELLSGGSYLAVQPTMTNFGTITVSASGFARGVAQPSGTSSGPDLYTNSGTISANGGSGAIALQVNFFGLRDTPMLVNSGTLRATDGIAGDSATALVIQLSSNGTVWNSGTIEGEFAIRITDGTTATSGFSQIIYNSGNILGRVEGGSYDDSIVNTGLVRGNVALGSGADRFDGRQGRLEGALSGGDNNDVLLTGQGSQSLSGDFGDDILSGGAGSDTLSGGLGRDSFRFETGFGADVITDFNTGAAHDFIDVAGFTAAQSMVQQGSDVLISFSASDTLLLRNVTLAALTPAMIRFGAAPIAASTIPTAPGPAAAPVQPAANLVSNVTFLPLIGTDKADVLRGDLGPDVLRGLEGNDRLEGARGNDRLDGGTGDDHLYGGAGDDLFIVDAAGDIVFEAAGEGVDRVEASVGHYLFGNVENLTLVAGSGSIFGVGNDLDNLLVGNEGANLLIAGAGADVVRGGAGGDALFGQAGKDVLEGEAGVDYLVGGGDADTILGGADADALYGEDGDDSLDGGDSFDTDILVGGAGNDVLDAISGQVNPDYDLIDGGAGNDAYYVDTGADLTFEGIDGGTDTVYADVPVAGAGVYLYANVENLVLLGTTSFGVGNELANNLTGNAQGNFLLGGAGDDILNGMAGGDVLFGEGGADIFLFNRGTGGDVIADFARGIDRIDLRAFGFASFAQLQSAFIQVGDVGAINLGNGDLVVLHNVTMSQLVAADFIL